MRFCPNCGKRTELIEGLCSDCYNETHKLKLKAPTLKFCTSCRKYLYKNKWNQYQDIRDTIKKLIQSDLKEKSKIQIKLPQYTLNPGVNVDGEAEITIRNNIYNVPLNLEFTLCEKCGKQGTTYFEGILQLRNPNQEVESYIENDIASQHDKGIFINNKEPVTNGYDYYLTSQRYLQTLGKKLKKRFKGELKTSVRIFTRNKQTSRDVYRVSVLFKLN